jgi:hypothetical protein
MNAEAIRAAISDPAMLDTLINGMDNFSTLAKDAQDEFNHLLSQIDEIPERKIVEIVFNQSREDKIINAGNAAAQMFDAYKMIDENTLKNKEGNTFAGLQVQMDDLNNQAKIAQNAINMTQSKIDTMQQEVDADQRKIESDFTRPIEKKQREIDKLTRSSELSFTRPIQELQDRSAILSHDLDVMNHAAEQINEKYDKQQEALSAVADINQQIINQQQQQIGLADALTKGDISAAANAVQQMRASNAANYADNSQKALQQARENEVGALRGGVSGLTQKQINEEQYTLGQQVYALELKKAAVDKQILDIQDAIYQLEEGRQIALDAVQVKTDAIAKITFGTLLDEQNKLKAINDQILPLQSQSDLLALIIGQNDKNRIIHGQTRAEWDLSLKAAEAQKKLLEGEMALALAATASVSGDIKGSWDDIKAAYDGIVDKDIQITQWITEKYGTVPNPGDKDPDPKTEPEPTKSPGAAWIPDGKGGWKKPDKPAGDYGWDDTKGWVKGYYKDESNIPKTGGSNDSAATAAAKLAAAGAYSPSKLAAGESGAIGAASIAAQIKAAADKAADAAEKARIANAQSVANAAKLAGLQAQYDSDKARMEAVMSSEGGLKGANALKSFNAKYPNGRPVKLAKGGLIDPAKFLSGGFSVGKDTVPAMLAPGEFVMSKYAVDSFGVNNLKAINNGSKDVGGDSVYNYSLTVNTRSDASPDEIARTVMAQLKQIDSQRIRGVRI